MNALKITLGMLILLTTTLPVGAQFAPEIVSDSEAKKESEAMLTEVNENDYPAFLHLGNLKKYANVKFTGVDMKSRNLEKFFLEVNSNQIEIKAWYNKQGQLIEGRLVKSDIALPSFITRYLGIDALDGWEMTGNKKMVSNFDPQTTEYVVVIEKEGQKKKLYFNSYGARISGLSSSGNLAFLDETVYRYPNER